MTSRRVLVLLVCWLVLVIVSSVYAQVVRVRGVPHIVYAVADEVVFLLNYKKTEISWDRTHVANLPDGSIVKLVNDSEMTKEDWIAAAGVVMNDLQARIDAINALK